MNTGISKWTGRLTAAASLFAALSAGAAVPLASNLSDAGRQALSGCKPLLLEFSALACDYCRLLETEILNPTLLNRDYDDRVLMQKLLVDHPEKIRGFNGKPVTPEQLAGRYRVFVTPTLLFVDDRGRELAERMVGVTTLDFYGGYLDNALETAQEKLRQEERCP